MPLNYRRCPQAAGRFSLAVFAFLMLAADGLVGADDSALEAILQRAGDNRGQLEAALEKLEGERREGLRFLLEHMPEGDLRSLTSEYLVDNVRLAYEVRDRVPWGKSIPGDIFLNDVLPYASINERRDAWRADFVERFLPLVEKLESAGEAAQLLNRSIFKELGVRYSTKRRKADQSPYESTETGLASCTGLSVLLADACRAVCVPARLAGIASWVNKRGNHTWVEVWDGRWHFTGAAEPSGRGLDHAWFQGDASLAVAGSRRHAIWATSFRRTEHTYPMVWARDVDWVWAVDVTSRYAKRQPVRDGHARILVRVRDQASRERIAVPVEVRARSDGRALGDGASRDESADTNDILAFELPVGGVYDLLVGSGLGSAWRSVELDSAEERNFDFSLPSSTLRVSEIEAAQKELAAAFEAGANASGEFEVSPQLDALLARDPRALRRLAWTAWRTAAARDAGLRADYDARRVRTEDRESPYTVKDVGTRPAAGWPLVIAGHGGGGVPKRVNDSQWRHMQIYYRDHPEVGGYRYLALRAPNDAWNGFYDDAISPLVLRLIRQFAVHGDIDTDKVYVIGYSHGGYGAYVIGTKIPDRFAAVHSSAAAPTGGETALLNLRNTVFSAWVGERDTAYGRRDRCVEARAEVEKLRGDRKDIYPADIRLFPGFGHGGLPDRDRIVDLYAQRRVAAPRELSWKMTDERLRNFFWLHCEKPESGRVVRASIDDNVLELDVGETKAGKTGLRVRLDERLVDLERPLTIRVGDVERPVDLEPKAATLLRTLAERGDASLAASVEVSIDEVLSRGSGR